MDESGESGESGESEAERRVEEEVEEGGIPITIVAGRHF